ncbi:MAG: hypothetical protein OXC26_10510 [Albidovulum sp.]|nr:hypothetical protein [Albidovulum sp.]
MKELYGIGIGLEAGVYLIANAVLPVGFAIGYFSRFQAERAWVFSTESDQ